MISMHGACCVDLRLTDLRVIEVSIAAEFAPKFAESALCKARQETSVSP